MDALPYIDFQQTRWIPNIYPSIEIALSKVAEEKFFICIDEQDTVVGSMILNNQFDDEYQNLKWFEAPEDVKYLIVHTLISRPKRLQQGIASQMITFMKKYATENNMFSIESNTSIDNVLAHKLYEKNDFSYFGCHNLANFDGTDLMTVSSMSTRCSFEVKYCFNLLKII